MGDLYNGMLLVSDGLVLVFFLQAFMQYLKVGQNDLGKKSTLKTSAILKVKFMVD